VFVVAPAVSSRVDRADEIDVSGEHYVDLELEALAMMKRE
jgi:hypothetical protein